MHLLLGLSSANFLTACQPPIPPDDTGEGVADTGIDDTATDDTDDTGLSGPATLAIGEVADMTENDDGSVSVDVTEAGTYVVILVSQSILQGTSFGYADAAESEARTEAADAMPALPERIGPPLTRAAVGDEREFTVYDGSGYETVTAEVTAVDGALTVWTDLTTTNELGTVDADTVQGVLDTFNGFVLARERQAFGEESDVDGNGQIELLLSYAVNQYGAVAYVTQCDIGRTSGCGNSGNGSEVVYLGIPDPDDAYGTVSGISETVAHELNHLIYGWHKYVAQGQPDADENIYLTEGMSALAQDLTGYNNGNQYVWAAALDAEEYLGEGSSIDSVSVNDFLRGSGYYDVDRDGPLRGAAYLYLRYLFEQMGGMTVEADGTLVDAGGFAFLHDWFDAPELGSDTVPATTGREVNDVTMDWYTALLVTGLVENDNPAWTYQDQVVDPVTGYNFGVDPHALIHGWLQLEGPKVQKIGRADGSLRAGGVEYLKVEVEAGVGVAVPVDADAKAQARILRIE